MNLATLIRSTIAAAYVVGCGSEEPQGCQRDTDCAPEAGRYCIDNICQSAGGNGGDDPVPWYEGMCDDVYTVCLDDGGKKAAEGISGGCYDTCHQGNESDVGAREYCANLICSLEIGACFDTEHVAKSDEDQVRQCMDRYGFLPQFEVKRD